MCRAAENRVIRVGFAPMLWHIDRSFSDARSRYLRVRVFDNDDKPLAIRAIVAEAILRRVIFPVNATQSSFGLVCGGLVASAVSVCATTWAIALPLAHVRAGGLFDFGLLGGGSSPIAAPACRPLVGHRHAVNFADLVFGKRERKRRNGRAARSARSAFSPPPYEPHQSN